MYWQNTPYVLPQLLAAAIVAALVPFTWRRRTAPGATALIVLMLAIAEWSLGYALELAGADLSTKLFWARVEYLGIVTIPLAWLAFALQYTDRGSWLTARNLALLSAIPLITVVLVWTNAWHGLIWTQTRLDDSGPFLALEVVHGAWFWVHSIYAYLLLLLATTQLILMALRTPRLYRWQSAALLVGSLTPWLGNGLYLSGLAPIPNLDLTPLAFTLSGIALAYGLLRFRLLDIVPVARRAIVDGMRDGVMVLDTQNRIVDLNLAAERLIGFSAAEVIGKPADQVLASYAELVAQYRDVTEEHAEIVIWADSLGTRFGLRPQSTDDVPHHYELRISPLTDRNNHLLARLIILHDITNLKQSEAALRAVRDELEARVEERTAELTRVNIELLNEISERKRVEELVKASLREKEVLLQEIHHRVKNNLQIISSLLNLQSGYIEDPYALEILWDSQHRIRSMALIHEKLHRSKTLDSVNFAEYIRDLVAYLFGAYSASERGITLNIKTDSLFMGIDMAVTCGLILNELLSNSLQHAFLLGHDSPADRDWPFDRDSTNGDASEIRIELSVDRDKQVTLVVGDNGVGFPPELDFRDTTSLGLQLVNTLVDQLDGTIELDSRAGTEFKIRFSTP